MSKTPSYSVAVTETPPPPPPPPPPKRYLVRWVGYYIGSPWDSGSFEITEAELPNWPVCKKFESGYGYYRHVEEVVPI